MPQFRYQAVSADEQTVAGEIEAENVAEAISQLTTRGLVVQSIGFATPEKTRLAPRPADKASPVMSLAEQAELERHLTRIVTRGRRLVPALRAYAAEMPTSRARTELLDLVQVLDMADTSQAVHSLQRLPPMWIPLLSSATVSDDPGHMIDVFIRESQQASELSRQWRQTLAYPLLVLCGATAVLIFFSLVVIPIFRDVFLGFGLRLPALTWMVLIVADWISSGRVVLVAAVIGLAAFVAAKVVPALLPDSLRNWLSDRFGKPLGRSTALAQLSQFLADLIEGEFETGTALRMAAAAAASPRLKRAAHRVARELDSGSSVSDLPNRRVLTSSILHAVRADLPTNTRTALLRELSRCHAERASAHLSWTRGIVEPISIVLVGLIVGVTVIGLFLPLLTLIQGLS